MPIALESGARFGRGAVPHQAPPPACGGGTSSAGRGSDSSAAAVHREESEEGDGEVQSSYRGPLETMDALQDALPRRREVSKPNNSKLSSLVNAGDDMASFQPAKDIANPENPSPKKRKGLLPFGINKNELQSKKLSPVGDVTNSTTNCRKSLYPAVTSSSPSKSRRDDDHVCCKNLPCHCLQRKFGAMDPFASPPVTLETQLISVQMRSVSTVDLQDVVESTAEVSPREKRRKN